LFIVLSAPPWFSAIFLGLGSGGSFSLNLLLPIEFAGNAQEASSWAAMTQSIGYIIGAARPVLLGRIYDATHSFTYATAGLIVMTIVMFLAQLFAVRN